MQSGLINKVATIPANLPDAQGLRHVCPSQGAIYGIKDIVPPPHGRLLSSTAVISRPFNART
jgi:hypothetical protein